MTTCLAPPPAPHKPPHDRRQPAPKRTRVHQPSATAPIMRPPNQHCVCTPRRIDLFVDPVHASALGEIGTAITVITSAFLALLLAFALATTILG